MDMSNREILDLRGPKNNVDPSRPYAFLHERERTAAGSLEDFATVFLTNRECPFRCLMCDLWKNTTDQQVPPGAIPEQIRYALDRLPPAEHIKLYNSGNFFDPQAIPPEDHAAIAKLVAPFKSIVVENHPKLTDPRVLSFQNRVAGQLEVAIGLETIHPRVLPSLNKQMTLDDFDRAVLFLKSQAISVRAFVLLKPPGLDEQQGVDWAVRSIEYAIDRGVDCVSVIPVRSGNGAVDRLIQAGAFAEPELRSLELVAERGVKFGNARVFVDLWDAERFATCKICCQQRIDRLARMNDEQTVLPKVVCDCQS